MTSLLVSCSIDYRTNKKGNYTMENTALIRTEPAEIEAIRRSLPELWADHLAREVRAGQISEATAATYRRGLKKFTTWGAADPERASDHAIKEWIADLRERKTSQNAISVWFAGVRAFFQWAISEHHVTADPTQGVKRGKRKGTAQAHKREMLTDDEMIRVLNSHLSTRNRAMIFLLAYTGARGVELHRANIEDLRTDGGELVLHVQGKGRNEADEKIILAHPDAKNAVYNLLSERKTDRGPLFVSEGNRTAGGRLGPRAMRRIVREVLDDAGITSRNKTTHSFRHSAITNAIRNGASLLDAQAMARHSSANTTGIYYHNLDRMTNAAEKRIDYRAKAKARS